MRNSLLTAVLGCGVHVHANVGNVSQDILDVVGDRLLLRGTSLKLKGVPGNELLQKVARHELSLELTLALCCSVDVNTNVGDVTKDILEQFKLRGWY